MMEHEFLTRCWILLDPFDPWGFFHKQPQNSNFFRSLFLPRACLNTTGWTNIVALPWAGTPVSLPLSRCAPEMGGLRESLPLEAV